MNILVINCGSSSIKAEIINTSDGSRILGLKIGRVISDAPEAHFSDEESEQNLQLTGHKQCLEWAFPKLIEKLGEGSLSGVGHRVVHGGEHFDRATLIDDEVERTIDELAHLAPLHNPINLIGIEIARAHFPDLSHIAVFDTAFHQTLPKRAKAYALPKSLMDKHGIRRYGFHGTSHDYVSKLSADFLQSDVRDLRIISCHLGNGCSIAAIEYGRSIETSMGMTPLEGLVMGTRSGDVDPGILTYLSEKEGLSYQEIDHMLNKESGLKGLSGIGNDMRDIIEKAGEGDEDCRLAVHVFTHRVRKYIGAYATVMGGVDAIVFTGGIGENSAVIRHRIAQRLDFLGAIINEDKNRDLRLNASTLVGDFSMQHSRARLLAVATDEQYSIAQQCERLISERNKVNTKPSIPIAISARHVHLTQEAVDALFGKGHQLTVRKPLSQPGQFACEEMVTIVGPKSNLERVRVLGPTRSKNQVEISRTDEFKLGIDAPIRASGHVENSPGCTLIGTHGKIELSEGVICAWRHIHMTPEDAVAFGVKDKDVVAVEVNSDDRSLIYGNVLIRVSSKYKLEMHIDTDEGNAAEITRATTGSLQGTVANAHLKQRKV